MLPIQSRHDFYFPSAFICHAVLLPCEPLLTQSAEGNPLEVALMKMYKRLMS